ncbi:Swt1 family HEPN domain-containing protein [Mycolicibacterium stellerae]|uniref:Swt1 family HEPN domain-containing protein n=1 Tax=Mycolicibacterium stellerae TaxID=2358193 RepID=UPI0019D0066A|nr:Swt1 family HEPN domain-containing protein [Mycolicibacterium stellerae]
MSEHDSLRTFLFRSLMFEAEAETFRQAGVRVGLNAEATEERLFEEAIAPFPLAIRNDAIRMARLYALLYCFENAVRELIQNKLSDVDTLWWNTKVPKKIHDNAETRLKDAQDNSWIAGLRADPLGFVDFGGLSDIIVNNWSEFEDLIPSQHWLKQRLDELERARNFVAHHRMLSEPEFARLEMYVTDWNRQVGL